MGCKEKGNCINIVVIPGDGGYVHLLVISTKEKSVELLYKSPADPSFVGMTANFL